MCRGTSAAQRLVQALAGMGPYFAAGSWEYVQRAELLHLWDQAEAHDGAFLCKVLPNLSYFPFLE
jgi:hypothetical protein